MDGSGLNPIDPSWSPEPTRLQAALRGARETPLVPPFILFSTFVGFGALTNATGFSALDTFFMSAFVFALPGQVVLVDQMARGASVLTAAIAVAATGVRLLPMTVSILPMIRDRRVPKWMEFVLAYYCAVTVWVETMRRAPGVPKHLRAPYALGVAGLMLVASNAGALLGFGLASGVPQEHRRRTLVHDADLFSPLHARQRAIGAEPCAHCARPRAGPDLPSPDARPRPHSDWPRRRLDQLRR